MMIDSAEVWAIHRAINIIIHNKTNEYRQQSVVIKSDSSNVVSWCNGENGGPWNLNLSLNFIKNVLRKSMNITLVRKGRDLNIDADTLAKQGFHRAYDFIAWL